MKKMPLFIVTILLITACSKKNNGPDQALLENYPQTWILTYDEVPGKYTFLKTNGAVMYRDDVETSYSLTQMAIDEECEFEVNTSRTEDGGKICYTLRLDKNKKIWCGAGPSSNQQEIQMFALNTSSTDPGDGYKFFIHKMPDVNGVKTVALESVQYPGYYVSHTPLGWQFAQNLVSLQKADSPEKATAWQCR
jgi:hypothetical protein